MRKTIKREDILTELQRLAFCKNNDAVKLAFLRDAGPREIARLDLRGVQSIRIAEKGLVEIKLIDRDKLIALLLAAVEERPDPAAAAGGLINAINGAADRLGALPEQQAETGDVP